MKNPSVISTIFLLLMLPPLFAVAGQVENPKDAEVNKPYYIRIVPSLIAFFYHDRYSDFHSMGIRILGEYKQEFRHNWFYGIGFEGFVPATGYLTPLVKNLSISVNYRLPLVGDRLFLTKGLGLGSNFIFIENDPLKVRPSLNVSLYALWRISPTLYLEFSPFFIVLPTRHTMPFPGAADRLISIPGLSLGLQIRI